MKRSYVFKIICFLLIGAVLFTGVQSVLRYKSVDVRKVYSRNRAFEEEQPGSVDAVFLGTSEIFVGVAPATIYGDTGITSYNMAMTHTSAVITYYQLMYVLKHQTPKVVLCDFSALYTDALPSSSQESLYWRFLEGSTDLEIKYQLIRDIPKIDEKESLLTWALPLFRFHSSWDELTEDNFIPNHTVDAAYDANGKGCELRDQPYDGGYMEVRKSLWETDEVSDELFSDLSMDYYHRMVDACHERGIRIVAIIPPKMSDTYRKVSRWPFLTAYFESLGVDVLDYNNFEQAERMGLVVEEDYFNPEHLSCRGALKFSHVIAEDLKDRFGLPDHREDAAYSGWGDSAAAFSKEWEGK